MKAFIRNEELLGLCKTQEEYNSAWTELYGRYKNLNLRKIDYLQTAWLTLYKKQYVKCYTDKI